MAETVSDKDVVKAREKVDRLREQIAEEQSKAAAVLVDGENQVRKARLDAEAARLEAQLAALKESNKVSVQREATAAVVEQVAQGQGDLAGTTTTVVTEEPVADEEEK